MEPADVVKPAIVGFTDDRIDAAHVMVIRLSQGPTGHGCRSVPDAQSIAKDNGRFNLTKLCDLRGTDEFAKRVVDGNCARHFVLKNISGMRQYGRDSCSNVVGFDDGDLADVDAGHVRDSVVGPRIVDAGMDPQFARSRAVILRGSLRREH